MLDVLETITICPRDILMYQENSYLDLQDLVSLGLATISMLKAMLGVGSTQISTPTFEQWSSLIGVK